MNPFLKSPNERRQAWKLLRHSLPEKPEADQLQMVAAFWAQAPLGKAPFDITDCTTWGNPWEMIAENDWCRDSIAIGMEATLRLGGWDPSRLRLYYLNDFDLAQMVLVLRADDAALNYEFGRVIAYPPGRAHRIIQEWMYAHRDYVEVNRAIRQHQG